MLPKRHAKCKSTRIRELRDRNQREQGVEAGARITSGKVRLCANLRHQQEKGHQKRHIKKAEQGRCHRPYRIFVSWAERDKRTQRKRRQRCQSQAIGRNKYQPPVEPCESNRRHPHYPHENTEPCDRLVLRLSHLVEFKLSERRKRSYNRHQGAERTVQKQTDHEKPRGQSRQCAFQDRIHYRAIRSVDSRAGPIERIPSFAPESSMRRSTYALALGGRSSIFVMLEVSHIQPSISS